MTDDVESRALISENQGPAPRPLRARVHFVSIPQSTASVVSWRIRRRVANDLGSRKYRSKADSSRRGRGLSNEGLAIDAPDLSQKRVLAAMLSGCTGQPERPGGAASAVSFYTLEDIEPEAANDSRQMPHLLGKRYLFLTIAL